MVQTTTHFTCPFLKAIRLNVDLKSYFPNQEKHSSSNPHSRQQPQPVVFCKENRRPKHPTPAPHPFKTQPFFVHQKKKKHLPKTSPEKAGGPALATSLKEPIGIFASSKSSTGKLAKSTFSGSSSSSALGRRTVGWGHHGRLGVGRGETVVVETTNQPNWNSQKWWKIFPQFLLGGEISKKIAELPPPNWVKLKVYHPGLRVSQSWRALRVGIADKNGIYNGGDWHPGWEG